MKCTIRKIIEWYIKLSNIRKALDQKSIDVQVTTFNDTIRNTFRNFVPNKYITFDDKDPVRISETIKSKIKTNHIQNLFFCTILRWFIISVKNAFLGLFFRKQKRTRVFQWQEDINDVVISALSSTKLCLSFWNFNF